MGEVAIPACDDMRNVYHRAVTLRSDMAINAAV